MEFIYSNRKADLGKPIYWMPKKQDAVSYEIKRPLGRYASNTPPRRSYMEFIYSNRKADLGKPIYFYCN